MKDIVLALFTLGVLALGTAAPFIATLGYLWASLLKPQTLAYGFFKSVPIAMVFALVTVVAYFVVDRRSPPKFTMLHLLMGLFAIWVTLTSFLALHPEAAWWKWDWAFKEIAFACFIPFVIRSRIHMEALLYVLTVGTVPLVVSAGLKVLVGGGGYGEVPVPGQANVGLAESSTLAMFAAMTIVMVLHLRKYTLIMPRNWIATVAAGGYIALCLLAATGGYARTGLLALGCMAFGLWWFSRYKVSLALLFVVVAGVVLSLMSDQWFARMETILQPTQDASASTRLYVWGWTLDFVRSHPFGGGFGAYLSNVGFIPGEDKARAFHSIYFEVLGEHGYVGLALFSSILLTAMKMSFGLYIRNKNNTELLWLSNLAKTVLICLAIFATGGSFIGVAFQPFLYLLSAMVIVMRSYEGKYSLSTGMPRHPTTASARFNENALQHGE